MRITIYYIAIYLYYLIAFLPEVEFMDFIVYGIDFKHTKGEFCTRQILPFYFVSYFRTDYVIEIDGKLVDGVAGDMYISRPGDLVYHGPREDSQNGFTNDWLYISGDDFGELLEKIPLPVGKPFHIGGAFYLAGAIEKIHREKAFKDVGYREMCATVMSEAIIKIYRDYKKNIKLSVSARLAYVRGELMKDYKRSWSLADIAKLSGYSESRLSALYKKEYGISPINDLLNRRIKEAKLLILYGNMSLSEIAEATGFSSIYYFSKHFKKKEGISPREYKESCISGVGKALTNGG